MASTELQVLVVGGGVVGAGVALDAATSGLSVGLVEARDFGVRHLVAVQQAHPRRPALPGAAQLRPGPGGAHRAGAAAAADRAAPGPAGARSCSRSPTTAGSAPTSAPASASTTRSASRSARPRGLPGHRQLTRRARAAAGARAQALGAHRRAASTGTRRSTTPVTCSTLIRTAAGYGAQVASRTQVTGLPARGGAGHRRARGGPGDRRRAGDPGPAGGQRDRRVDRRDPGDGRRPRVDQRAGVQGRAPGRAAGPDPLHAPGSSCGRRCSVLFVIPWGRHWIIGTTDTDWSLAQGAPGRQPGRHRLRARARSTGSSQCR